MPEIKLTQKELDHLRSYYEYELEEAHHYIKQLKSIIRKLDAADYPTVVKPLLAAKGMAMPSGKKTGQPNNATMDAPAKPVPQKPKAKHHRPKKEKPEHPELISAKPDLPPTGKPLAVKPEIPTPGMPVSGKPSPAAPPKPKRKRKSNYRPQGVFLTSLSKPLPKLPDDDVGLPYGSTNTHR